MAWYTPTSEITEEERARGLRVLTWESLSSHTMTLLVTGAFLPGMALALGASNFVIGVLASFAPIAQMAQIPAILLVDKIGLRKLISVVFVTLARLSLVAAALTPFLAPENLRVTLFVIFMIVFFLDSAFSGCSWASILKDIIPEGQRGSILASKLAAATAIGAVLSIAAGFSIDGLTKVFTSIRNSFLSTSGLSMGMRRMTAFPYEMLRKTGKSITKSVPKSKKPPVPPTNPKIPS